MDTKIKEIIDLYERLTGRQIIPKDTDYKKTYQYRYAAKFVNNMKYVPWDTAKKIAYYAIEYARNNLKKNNTIWTRGLWVLTKANIVDIAYSSAKSHEARMQLDLEKTVNSKKFVDAQETGLAETKVEGGFPNIVMWYENNSVNLTYIAMSEICKRVMAQLDSSSKSMLPPQDEIIRRRVKCLIDDDYSEKLKKVLGDDYIKIV